MEMRVRMRSKLFVPAIRPELFSKAVNSAADAICFDLEDSVPAARKSEARDNLHAFFNEQRPKLRQRLLVRVNSTDSPDFPLDMNAIVRPGLFAVALPKVETVEAIWAAAQLLSELELERDIQSPIALLVTVESPRGLRRAFELAASSPRICGLQLGFADLLEPLGILSEQNTARQQIRLVLRLAAGEAGLDCYEAAYPLLRDHEGFLAQLADARALGFVGASCIHPEQIEAANRVFTPTSEEIDYAKGVLAAVEKADRDGDAVAMFNCKMIDRPFLLRAKAILLRRLMDEQD